MSARGKSTGNTDSNRMPSGRPPGARKRWAFVYISRWGRLALVALCDSSDSHQEAALARPTRPGDGAIQEDSVVRKAPPNRTMLLTGGVENHA